MQLRVSVLGAGSFGTTIAHLATQNAPTLLWCRRAEIADEINAGGYDVLRYVGGRISPEMETPKILWMKRNLPESYRRATHFFDLPDYLTWRATGDATRSLCSTVCKMTYLGHEGRWDPEYFTAIGLEDHVADDCARRGQNVRAAFLSLLTQYHVKRSQYA